jgi:HAD superfamily hydrolase (TIGR01509 family)
MMSLSVANVLFDFGGTLDAHGVSWRDRFHAYYRAEGLDMAPESFASKFYVADDQLVGRLPFDADLSTTVHRLASNVESELTRCGTRETKDAPRNDRGHRVAARFLAETTAVFARNRPFLEALRTRYRIGVVSNFYGNLEAVCRSAELAPLITVAVDSHRVGATKPDPAIFRVALDSLGATPETTLFVGDSLPRDREGALRVGMSFIWIASRDAQEIAVGAEGKLRDQLSVARLTDLAEILM